MSDENTDDVAVFASTNLEDYNGSTTEKTEIDSTTHLGISVSLFQLKKKFNDDTGTTQMLSGLRIEFEKDADVWAFEQESGNLSSGKTKGIVNKRAYYDPEAVREFIFDSIVHTDESATYFSDEAANHIISDLEIPDTYPTS